MKTLSEIAHAHNLNNFDQLVSYLKEYEVKFKSKNYLITNEKLSQVASLAKEADQKVVDLLNELCTVLTSREEIFSKASDIGKFLASYLQKDSLFKNCLLPAQKLASYEQLTDTELSRLCEELKNAGKFLREIELLEPKYNKQVQAAQQVINILIAMPAYNSTESKVSISMLTESLKNMETIQSMIKDLKQEINTARMGRYNVLYRTDSGLVDVAHDTKVFMKSTYGGESKEWKDLSGIDFKRIK